MSKKPASGIRVLKKYISNDLVITYTITNEDGSYGGSSDQNNRITFVLEIKDGAIAQLRSSETVSSFTPSGDDNNGAKFHRTGRRKDMLS